MPFTFAGAQCYSIIRECAASLQWPSAIGYFDYASDIHSPKHDLHHRQLENINKVNLHALKTKLCSGVRYSLSSATFTNSKSCQVQLQTWIAQCVALSLPYKLLTILSHSLKDRGTLSLHIVSLVLRVILDLLKWFHSGSLWGKHFQERESPVV